MDSSGGTVDFQGIAILIGAVVAAIVTLGGFVLQVLIFLRQGRLHVLVNSQSEKLNVAIAKNAFADGVQAGTDAERKNPMVPTP